MKTKILGILFIFALTLSAQTSTVKRVLYIGDSITDGAWGNSGGSNKPSEKRTHWDQNHLLGHGYVYLCAARYTAEHSMEDVTFMNRGISGDSLMGMKARWQQDVIALKPDILSVLIGTNDVNEWLRHGHLRPFDFTGWEQTYRSLLDSARTANPCIHLVLCSPFVAPSGKVGKAAGFCLRQEMIVRLRGIVERIAGDYNALFVDFNALFDRLQQQAPRPDYWIWDGIHPTPAGHQQMSDLWNRIVFQNKQ